MASLISRLKKGGASFLAGRSNVLPAASRQDSCRQIT